MRAIQTTRLVHKAIQIPIRVCNVVKSSNGSTGLSNACPDCHANLSKPDICRACDKEVSHSEILKKYVLDKEEEHILTTEQLDELKNIDNDIKIEGSVSQDQFKSSLITGCFYLLPSTKLKKKSEQKLVEDNKKHYAKLREAIGISVDPIVVKFSIRQKEKLGVLKVENNAIILLTLAFNEYIQDMDEDLDIDLNPKELADSKKLAKSIPKTDLTKITDTYIEKLERIISGKSQPQAEKKEDDDMWGSL